MRSLALLLAVFVAGIAAQDSNPNNYTPPPTFNAGAVNDATKNGWCTAQRNNCPKICGGAASRNECQPDTLTFACVCIDGTVPNVASYKDTLPYYICVANRDQCVQNHPNDAEGQTKCQEDAKCGTKEVDQPEPKSSSTLAAATTMQTASATTTGKATTTAAAATAATSTGAAAALGAQGQTGLLVGALAALPFVL